jgi:peptide/nickel transport system substrate-binding protein
MMNTAAPPFDDIRARQALTFATPKQDYLDLINLGLTRSADQRFIPESKYYNPDVTQMADMPDEAVALAAEYCAERGGEQNPVLGTTTCTGDKINIELQWSGPAVVQTQIAELLDRGWSVAFNVTFNELPQDDHILQTAIGQYNVNTWRQFGAEDPMTDNVWLMCRNIGGISLNWPRYCSEERDALLLAAQASTDEAERIDLYQQVEQNINDAYTYVFFNHTKWNNAFAENVRGVCGRTSPEGEPLRCVSNGRNWFDAIWFVG